MASLTDFSAVTMVSPTDFSVVPMDRIKGLIDEIAKKERAYQQEKECSFDFKKSQNARNIKIINMKSSLISGAAMYRGILLIPEGARLFGYEILDFANIRRSKKTRKEKRINMVFELDRIPDLERLYVELKPHGIHSISCSESPEQIRVERKQRKEKREAKIDVIVKELITKASRSNEKACCMCGQVPDRYISIQFNRMRVCCAQDRNCIRAMGPLFKISGIELNIKEMLSCVYCVKSCRV
jgi:hypothetical protein